MCEYITATLPRDVDPGLIAPVFGVYKFGFVLFSNPHFARQITPGDRCILTTKKQCDCGTSIGSEATLKTIDSSRESLFLGSSVSRSDQDAYSHEIGKLRKRGWSQDKISKWLEKKEGKLAKSERQKRDFIRGQKQIQGRMSSSSRNKVGEVPELERWIGLLRELLTSNTVGRVGLLWHSYNKSVTNERISIVRRETVKVSELARDHLLRLEEDTLCEFVA